MVKANYKKLECIDILLNLHVLFKNESLSLLFSFSLRLAVRSTFNSSIIYLLVDAWYITGEKFSYFSEIISPFYRHKFSTGTYIRCLIYGVFLII